MSAEDDHLTQLRSAYDALRDGANDPGVMADAVRTLLRVSIAHHEQTQATKDDTVFNAGAFSAP